MTRPCYALMRGGRIYTLLPYRGEPNPAGWKWAGYCNGDRCGFFRSKKQFEAFVALEPEGVCPQGGQAEASMRAESLAGLEGRLLLQDLARRWKAKRERS